MNLKCLLSNYKIVKSIGDLDLDILGIEIIQGISGSIGIVLAVPITAIIASYLCIHKRRK